MDLSSSSKKQDRGRPCIPVQLGLRADGVDDGRKIGEVQAEDVLAEGLWLVLATYAAR